MLGGHGTTLPSSLGPSDMQTDRQTRARARAHRDRAHRDRSISNRKQYCFTVNGISSGIAPSTGSLTLSAPYSFGFVRFTRYIFSVNGQYFPLIINQSTILSVMVYQSNKPKRTGRVYAGTSIDCAFCSRNILSTDVRVLQ